MKRNSNWRERIVIVRFWSMKEIYLVLHFQISRSEKISPGGLYSFRVFSFHLYSCVVQRIPLRSVSFRMTRRFYVRISHLHKIQFIYKEIRWQRNTWPNAGWGDIGSFFTIFSENIVNMKIQYLVVVSATG